MMAKKEDENEDSLCDKKNMTEMNKDKTENTRPQMASSKAIYLFKYG